MYFDYDDIGHLHTMAAFVSTLVMDGEVDLAGGLLYDAFEATYNRAYDYGREVSECHESHYYGECE